MKLAIVGQQDFGKAVLEAFLARGDTVAGVFCAPEKEGARPDSLRVAAQDKGLKVHQFKSLKAPEAAEALKAAGADIGIMAFVLQFAPQEFVRIPKHGTIQYHPSLLPKYRGPSSINWPISRGEKETGLTIFRPTDGLDEGAVILHHFLMLIRNNEIRRLQHGLDPHREQPVEVDAAQGVVLANRGLLLQDHRALVQAVGRPEDGQAGLLLAA